MLEPNFLQMMRRITLTLLCASFLVLAACSPRDYLSRRLAFDLIASSDLFKTPQPYVLQTGVVSNKDYVSPEHLVLEHHGWITATNASCTPGLAPSPCWDITLTPSGVDTVHAAVPAADAAKPSVPIPAARRQLVAVTGVSRQGIVADVEFTWHWVPMNEIGAALYSGDVRFRSTVRFRQYDDGWRIVQYIPQPAQTLDDALKNAEPTS
jgi:hypothetical protein